MTNVDKLLGVANSILDDVRNGAKPYDIAITVAAALEQARRDEREALTLPGQASKPCESEGFAMNDIDKAVARRIFNDLLRLGDDDEGFIATITDALKGVRRDERDICIHIATNAEVKSRLRPPPIAAVRGAIIQALRSDGGNGDG